MSAFRRARGVVKRSWHVMLVGLPLLSGCWLTDLLEDLFGGGGGGGGGGDTDLPDTDIPDTDVIDTGDGPADTGEPTRCVESFGLRACIAVPGDPATILTEPVHCITAAPNDAGGIDLWGLGLESGRVGLYGSFSAGRNVFVGTRGLARIEGSVVLMGRTDAGRNFQVRLRLGSGESVATQVPETGVVSAFQGQPYGLGTDGRLITWESAAAFGNNRGPVVHRHPPS